jgi:hypothetical protein
MMLSPVYSEEALKTTHSSWFSSCFRITPNSVFFADVDELGHNLPGCAGSKKLPIFATVGAAAAAAAPNTTISSSCSSTPFL